jgi:hypothetical protein
VKSALTNPHSIPQDDGPVFGNCCIHVEKSS